MTIARRWLRHPAYRLLSEFTDGGLEGPSHARVARHLERCRRCRAEVQIIRDSDEAMRDVPVPALPDDFFDRVMRRRASKVVPLLPVGPLTQPADSNAPSRKGWATVGGGLALLVAAVATVTADRASADASALDIEAIPTNGSITLALQFEPSSFLRQADSLRVRGWIWGGRLEDSRPPRLVVTTLRRARGDRFDGLLKLENGIAHGWLAVESWSADRVDLNGGVFWEMPTKPLAGPAPGVFIGWLKALQYLTAQRVPVWDEIRRVSTEAILQFPESVDLWSLKAAYDFQLVKGDRQRDSLRVFHGDRLTDLFEGRTHSVPDLAALIRYAVTIGNTAAERRWLRSLEQMDPEHRLVGDARVRAAVVELRDDPKRLAHALEVEWDRLDAGSAFLASTAFIALKRTDQTHALMTWAERAFEWAPQKRDRLLLAALAVPSTREWAIELLPQRIHFHEAAIDASRPIYETRDRYVASTQRRAAALQAALGRALIDDGDVDGGTVALEAALQVTWDLETARSLLEVQDDGSGLASVRALVAVDPLAEPIGALPADQARAARSRLLAKVTRGVTRWTCEQTVLLGTPDGNLQDLDTRATTVVARWRSPPPAAARDEINDLRSLVSRLADHGVPLLLVGPEARFAELEEYAKRVGGQAFFQVGGSATEAWGGLLVREYVVIHDGRHWVYENAQDAVRLALLLAQRPRTQ